MTPGQTNSVGAVVVTYQPTGALLANVRRLGEQGLNVVTVDNGSEGESKGYLAQLEQVPGVQVICNGRNLGLGAALNIGAKAALATGCRWVAAFDQDSRITDHFVESMLAAYEQCPFKPEVALLAPVHCLGEAEVEAHAKRNAVRQFRPILVAMTSGCFIRGDTFDQVGWFDESLFIDLVDYDFCLRLARAGHKAIQSCQSMLVHELGSRETRSLFGLSLKITTHIPARRYYIARNRILIYKRHGLAFPVWMARDLAWSAVELGRLLFLERDKIAKLTAMWLGLRHGLAGRSGPLDDATLESRQGLT
jgi:rhamnosyltransferase